MPRPKKPVRSAEEREFLRPHLAEWFGHRVFPQVSDHPHALRDQETGRCPFLSQVAAEDMACVKSENSRGVCTVSAGSNGPRQDWLVCPHRALDDDLLHAMVRRLYGLDAGDEIRVLSVTSLVDDATRAEVLTAVDSPLMPRQFVTFQQLFGGEISTRKSDRNPELSFDVTVVELLPGSDGQPMSMGRYGVIEVQTTDTHGSYVHAVKALRGALDLHGPDFANQVASHPEWPGRKVEGPNISNVFKRTFYQIAFKFQLTRRDTSAGCILALPRPVWDSWQPFLGAPTLIPRDDGTFSLTAMDSDDRGADHAPPVEAPNWIYVFDLAEDPPADGTTTPIHVPLVVRTDAPTLSTLALESAPAHAVGPDNAHDAVAALIARRLGQYVAGLT